MAASLKNHLRKKKHNTLNEMVNKRPWAIIVVGNKTIKKNTTQPKLMEV